MTGETLVDLLFRVSPKRLTRGERERVVTMLHVIAEELAKGEHQDVSWLTIRVEEDRP